MAIQPDTRILMSVEDFERFVDLPENADRLFEYITGRAVEVPSNTVASAIANLIATMITMYVLEKNLGHVTGADGGYMVSGERYAPDVGFISYEKQAEIEPVGYNPQPPDLAVEVISNPKNVQELEDLRRKITNYLRAGTTVWVFDWTQEIAEIHALGQPVRVIPKDGMIDGDDVLPGFTLPLDRIYRTKPTE